MKKYIKTHIFLVLTVVLSVALILTSAQTIFLSAKSNKYEDRINAALTSADVANQERETMKNENDKTKLENAELEKINADLQFKINAAKKEIEDQKKLLKKLDKKTLIAAEKELAIENSPQTRVMPAGKVCYLTFDDGPSDRTIEILDVLDRYEVAATFFVVGSSKLQYLPRIVEKGHAIGLHANNHDYSKIYKSTDAYFKDLAALSDKVFDKIGVHPMIMRFPGGGSNKVSQKHCKGIMTHLTSQVQIKGYAYFDWNVDSGDASSKNVTAKTITDNVLSAAAKKDSICVLMHDISSKNATVEALPKIIEGLQKMGYRFEILTKNSYGFHHTVQN